MASASQHITLAELQRLVKKGIDSAHPLPYWVAAEVGELKTNYSGHCYIDLVEKGGDKGVPKARLSAVIWASAYKMISGYFAAATGRKIEKGMNILVKGMVSYHELYGLSFQITDIEPAYTLGDMQRQRQQTIEQLQADGVFGLNGELELPTVIQRIAVISSAKAAGYEDFCRQAEQNPYNYHIGLTLFPAVMQGEGAENAIIGALERIADRMDDFDAVVIIRGGGSQSDLGCFDSYHLCNNIAQFPLPVITGIGHDKDVSVADMVANRSLKTPTAVAVFIIDRNAEFEALVANLVDQVADSAAQIIDREQELARTLALRLKAETIETIAGGRMWAETTKLRLSAAAHTNIEHKRHDTYSLNIRTKSLILTRLASAKSLLTTKGTNLNTKSTHRIEALKQGIDLLALQIEASDPRRILSMGYAMVSVGGRQVRRVDGLKPHDLVKIHMVNGVVESEIKRIEHK